MEAEYITLSNFSYLSVRSKSIGLAHIAHYRIKTLAPFGIRNILYEVSSPVKHRTYKVIEARIDSRKDC